jgi:hypothetical protein
MVQLGFALAGLDEDDLLGFDRYEATVPTPGVSGSSKYFRAQPRLFMATRDGARYRVEYRVTLLP